MTGAGIRPACAEPRRSPTTSSAKFREVVVVDRRWISGLDRDDRVHLVRGGEAGRDLLDTFERPATSGRRYRAHACRAGRAVSGMTFVVVPARTYVMEITTGSNVSMRRVTKVWRLWMISAATVIGSRAR